MTRQFISSFSPEPLLLPLIRGEKYHFSSNISSEAAAEQGRFIFLAYTQLAPSYNTQASPQEGYLDPES